MLILVLGVLAAGLALASPALASEPTANDEATPASVLALQALSVLEQGLSHEEALERLELAVESGDQEGVDMRVVREALAALQQEEPDRAEALLKTAFPEQEHVIGVTFRPSVETARIVAGVVGGVLVALAVLGLLRGRHTRDDTAPEHRRGSQA